jgi:hypothetical protein
MPAASIHGDAGAGAVDPLEAGSLFVVIMMETPSGALDSTLGEWPNQTQEASRGRIPSFR